MKKRLARCLRRIANRLDPGQKPWPYITTYPNNNNTNATIYTWEVGEK